MEYKVIFALATSLLTGVTLNIPIRTLITAGISGTIAWSANQVILNLFQSRIIAAAFGAIAVGVTAEIFARIQKEPTTAYIITGIIPLVPGLKAFNAMQNFLTNNYNQGITLALQTTLISSYIASGLAVVSIAGRIYSKYKNRSD